MLYVHHFNRLFPLWAILLGALGFYVPAIFTPLAPAITWLLALIMFAMGLTLARADFVRVVREPLPVLAGLLLQFTVMPLAAWGVSAVLQLDASLTAGMVLVGTAAGGTASNVITWLAGGRVALSVSMTLASTLASIVLTPLITWWLLGSSITVPVWGMCLSILKIVVAPVLLGVAVHHVFPKKITRIEPALASIAVVFITLIIAIVVALNAGRLHTIGPLVLLAVVLHNAIGLGAGYGFGRLLGFDVRTARTLAIEVGMQNSGLAVALAQQFFTASAALPGALFSVWHNVSGSLLASFWRRQDPCDAGQINQPG